MFQESFNLNSIINMNVCLSLHTWNALNIVQDIYKRGSSNIHMTNILSWQSKWFVQFFIHGSRVKCASLFSTDITVHFDFLVLASSHCRFGYACSYGSASPLYFCSWYRWNLRIYYYNYSYKILIEHY